VNSEADEMLGRPAAAHRPLPLDAHGRLEHAFGAPLDQVRLHRGPDPARTAHALNARAFTAATRRPS
jgi:hypothetical protein